MGCVTIRVYAELNDFLPPARRQRDITYDFVVAPSVRDALESLGIPHTEIDVILVDGRPVGFDHRLADGERISAYPVFEAFDVAGLNRLRREPLRDPSFVADVHLGTLARNLRLLGFDTAWSNDADDAALADLASREKRILLTRDRGLLKRAAVDRGIYVRHDDPLEQTVDVLTRLDLGRRIAPFTRCLACNGVLQTVDKSSIVDQLPPRTREDFDDFARCDSCGRVFWKGSHHERLAHLVDDVRARLARP